jgi:hypothetical protein
MLNESDRNPPLILPIEATMTDYLIALRVFLLLQSKEHGNVHRIADSAGNGLSTNLPLASLRLAPTKSE